MHISLGPVAYALSQEWYSYLQSFIFMRVLYM